MGELTEEIKEDLDRIYDAISLLDNEGRVSPKASELVKEYILETLEPTEEGGFTVKVNIPEAPTKETLEGLEMALHNIGKDETNGVMSFRIYEIVSDFLCETIEMAKEITNEK